jgi:hypothetical protein
MPMSQFSNIRFAVGLCVLATACGDPSSGAPAHAWASPETPADDYTNYQLDFRPETAVVDDLAAVQNALVRADYETGELVFAPSFGGLAALTAGTKAVIAGAGIFRVTGRETTDEGEVVHVEAAPLTDVLENATITWRRSFVSAYQSSRLGVGTDESEGETIGRLREPLSSFEDGKLHYSGSIANFATTFDLEPGPTGLDFSFTSKYGEGETRISAALSGTLHGLTHEFELDIAGGELEKYEENYYAVDGDVRFNVGAVQLGGQTKIEVPARLSLPILIGPIPFRLDVGSGLEVQSSLVGSTSAIFSGSSKFTGSAGVKVTGGKVDYFANFDTVDLKLDKSEHVAVVTSGLDVLLNFPEVTVGIGVPKVADANAFMRFKTEGISNATVTVDVAGGVPIVSAVCIEARTNFGASYGGKAQFLGVNLFEDDHPLFGKLGPLQQSSDCKAR